MANTCLNFNFVGIEGFLTSNWRISTGHQV